MHFTWRKPPLASSLSSTVNTSTSRVFSIAQLRLHRKRQGNRWIEGLLWSQELPHVDWTRYHLQVIFVDDEHLTQARLAEGLLESIAEWNGFGRAIYPHSCGVHGHEGEHLDLASFAAMIGEAKRIGISAEVFKPAQARLTREDLDYYDFIIALNADLCADILRCVEEDEKEYYERKVFPLASFKSCCTDEVLLREGGTALLKRCLRETMEPELVQARNQNDIPSLGTSASLDEWQLMVNCILISTAGLFTYLVEAYPEDLEQQWLE
ncbi:hypothetical protein CYMTET_49874 [Cymbomonas tetramitiformis]|uniref:Phosphotyrosine protein phosphatase I domain-containing protein n=1 Tax=Cymbomonas tetramitiformis TaxID=36881 RepID=A0AAE0EU46_9CHLO|nr:hypothetical protein CYMTET_49874 [Cymbomonas tetramitiformis]